VASVLKTIVIFPFAALCIYLILPIPKTDVRGWLRKNLSKLAVFLLPGFLVWSGVFTYFGLLGRFGDFREAVFDYNRYYSGNILLNVWKFFAKPNLLFNQSLKEIWILVVLSIAWVPFSRREYGPLRRSFFIFLLFGIWAEVASPGKYFPHYYQLLIPILCIMSSLFFSDFAENLKSKKTTAITTGTFIVIFLSSLGFLSYYQAAYLKMTPEEISTTKYGPVFVRSYELARYVKSKTSPCDTIYEWGAEIGIYYYSQRKSASGIYYIYPLLCGSSEERFNKRKRLYESVTTSPPAIFIWNGRYGKLEVNMFSGFINEQYNNIGKYKEYTIYEYKHRKKDRDKDDCQ
jgi:hypothetical protein